MAIVLVTIVFSGCALKQLKNSQAYVVTLKTPKLRFSDTGFVRENSNSVGLEIFSSSNRVLELQISTLVCFDSGACMSKSSFNKEYLNQNYSDDILYNILKGRAIMDSKNLVKTDGGFRQMITDSNYNILYSVNQNSIEFRDSKNSILITLRKIY